ncbi:MAG: Dam family site-specific DNA-(adenine-N6)-methyltransferase [Proteobacteria bacterium]|nr:Dam family site-specific DNA-(adenine-N6)-methyltransferase [Pseudomonadota bacterium]
MHKSKASTSTLGRKPFLKWPGGKRWIAPLLAKIIGGELQGTYFEPFTGAASVFLELKPKKAVLSDSNGRLVEFLKIVRRHPNKVVDATWRFSNNVDCYYRVRGSHPRTEIGRAARFLFLNRTCWGGVYRLNRSGDFNVPFGNSGRKICSRAHVQAVAKVLGAALLKTEDFEAVMSAARKGDVIYADPPYTSRGENNGFLRYNESLFSWKDQQRLAHAARKARRGGAFVAVSALHHKDVLSLYTGWWVLEVPRSSLISCDVDARQKITEVLIFSRLPRYLRQRDLGTIKRIG